MLLKRRLAAPLAVLCLLASPAWATSTTVNLTTSWQKIAPAGFIDVQNVSSGQVFLTTTGISGGASGQTSPAPSDSAPGEVLLPGEHRCFFLPATDLYAKAASAASVVVMDNVMCNRGY